MNEKQIALFEAAEKGEIEKVKSLLAEGVPARSTNTYNETLLIVAIKQGHKELAEYLLTQDIDLHIQGYLTGTALTFAIFTEQNNIAMLLLDHEKQFNNNYHPGALNWAVWKNNLELLKILKTKGADFNLPGLSGLEEEDSQDDFLAKETSAKDTPFHQEYFSLLNYTPVCLTLCQRKHKMLEFLLQECKADANVPNSDGTLPLSIATRNSDEIATNLLVESNVNLDLPNENKEQSDMPAFLRRKPLELDSKIKEILENARTKRVSQKPATGSLGLFSAEQEKSTNSLDEVTISCLKENIGLWKRLTADPATWDQIQLVVKNEIMKGASLNLCK